ncbi:uncharacterized protein LOC128998043 [Macrosteles quadrilineatus]|uniref:uncharacterized protein LOC128998043 n=1 Tax=Macrosteles quadrilineatus TaxID=74068 RepID=UPI0023E1BBDF|nr:uncharacterized protein LOC128998043 [Macrosteles quadrilineatus]
MLAECCLVLLLSQTVISSPTLNLSKGCQCAIRKVIAESGTNPCPRSCSNQYQPVCGFNPCEEDDYPDMMFRTFNNECELEATICDGPGFLYQRVYPGICVMDHQDDSSCLFVSN